MAYKDLVVHLDDSKSWASRIEVAIGLAARHDAHLTGFYPIVEIPLLNYIRAEIPRDISGEHGRRGERACRCRACALPHGCGAQRHRL
jgi:hypothetical protein